MYVFVVREFDKEKFLSLKEIYFVDLDLIMFRKIEVGFDNLKMDIFFSLIEKRYLYIVWNEYYREKFYVVFVIFGSLDFLRYRNENCKLSFVYGVSLVFMVIFFLRSNFSLLIRIVNEIMVSILIIVF